MVILGGRCLKEVDNAGISIYDTEISDWIRIPYTRKFRHSIFVVDNSIYSFGGFNHSSPSDAIQNLTKIDLDLLLKEYPIFYKSLIKYRQNSPISLKIMKTNINKIDNIETEKPNKKTISSTTLMDNSPIKYSKAKIAEMKSNNLIVKSIKLNENGIETQEIMKTSDSLNPLDSRNSTNTKAIDLADHFLKVLLNSQGWISQIKANNQFMFAKEDIIALATECLNIIKRFPLVLKLRVPIKVFGDVHGQYLDLMRFFDLWGAQTGNNSDIESYDYLFLGDYVDRGSHSLEVICLLMALKIKFPDQIHLIRGNHEDRLINNAFGFSDECILRLSDNINDPNSVFWTINDLFDWLPLIAIVDEKILCVHGGIGSTFTQIEQITELVRPLNVIHEVSNPKEQLIVDLLWSDPSESDSEKGISSNTIRDPNGMGNIVKFGPDIVFNFLSNNNLLMILRAHECVMDGFERFAEGLLITVFSATDYCGKHKNAGAVLCITKRYEIIPKLIYPEENDEENWIDNESQKRPPTPPRWNAANFGHNESYD